MCQGRALWVWVDNWDTLPQTCLSAFGFCSVLNTPQIGVSSRGCPLYLNFRVLSLVCSGKTQDLLQSLISWLSSKSWLSVSSMGLSHSTVIIQLLAKEHGATDFTSPLKPPDTWASHCVCTSTALSPSSLRQLLPTRSCGRLTPGFLICDHFFLTRPKYNPSIHSRYSLKTVTRYSPLRHGSWQVGLPVHCWCGPRHQCHTTFSRWTGACENCGLILWAYFTKVTWVTSGWGFAFALPARKLYSSSHMLRAHFAGLCFCFLTFSFVLTLANASSPSGIETLFVFLTLLHYNTERQCLICHLTLTDDDDEILSE